MGDIVRAEKQAEVWRGTKHIWEIASELRAEFGEEVLAVRLADKIDLIRNDHNLILIEGVSRN